MRRTLLIGAVTLAILVACSPGEPVAVPDLTGMPLPQARDAADEAGIQLEEVDASGQDRAVFSAGNWSVERQDPPAETEVERRSTVTVDIVNVRDIDDEPEDVAADEPDQEPERVDQSDDEPGHEPSSTFEADVSARGDGLWIISEVDVHTCTVDVNSGIIRSGYTTDVYMMTAGEPMVIPWSDLTNRSGERFNYATTAPEMVTIDCYDEDDNWVVDTWAW